MIAMVVIIFEITGNRFLTLKAGHSTCKEENMNEPCRILERGYNKCAQEKDTNVHMTVCVFIYIICFPSGCMLSNDTLVAMNTQQLDPHVYCPLAEARTLEIRHQIRAGKGTAYEATVKPEK